MFWSLPSINEEKKKHKKTKVNVINTGVENFKAYRNWWERTIGNRTYHKPTQNTIKHDLVPGTKVWMDGETSLGHKSNRSNGHNKKIKYESSQACESQNSSNDPTNNGHKCSAAKENNSNVLLYNRISEQF